MRPPLKTQVIIALAGLLGIGCIAVLVALFPRTPVYGPADMLPAEHTLILIHNVQPHIQQALGEYIPALSTLPRGSGATAALLQLPDGSAHWITFSQSATPLKPGIEARNPAALSLLNTGTPLRDDHTFQNHLRTRSSRTWLYVNAPSARIVPPPALNPPVAPVSIGMDGQEVRIALTVPPPPPSPLTTGNYTYALPAALHMQAGDLQAFLQWAKHALRPERILAVQAILGERVRAMVGPDVSLRYDLLPLLAHQSALTVYAGSGIYVQAELPPTQNTLNAVLEGYRSTKAGFMHTQRTFDTTFLYNNVRVDTAVTDEESVESGWSVRTVRSSNHSLSLAIKGSRFVLSTQSGILPSILASYPLPVHSPLSNVVARGHLRPPLAEALLQRMMPGESFPLPVFPGMESVMQWEIGQEGTVTVLRLY